MTYRIFVSQPIPEPALELMRQYGEVEVFPWAHREISVDELCQAARRSDYIFTMHSIPITRSMLEANPNIYGYAVASPIAWFHDLEAIREMGVPLLVQLPEEIPEDPESWSPQGYGLNARATADLLVTHVLAAAYRFVESDRYCRERVYFQEMTMDLMGQGMLDKTVALYGFGKVARQAAKRFKAFEAKMIYHKRTRLSAEEEARFGLEWVDSPDELFVRGDYVCLLTNVEDGNLRMVGRAQFELMKPSAYFFNVARGRLTDEDALAEALRAGKIAGAGLDVFVEEPPYYHDSFVPEGLRKLDNVTLTPHNGGATYLSRGAQTLRIAGAIVADIQRRESAKEGAE
ncbi:MAG: hypothetical protein LBC97_12595 [Bifidobacteriaceae bacterium]|jgi:glyoxylate reductase|nr:hypothetical protein [Bifidobacteriaceae bacterium]